MIIFSGSKDVCINLIWEFRFRNDIYASLKADMHSVVVTEALTRVSNRERRTYE